MARKLHPLIKLNKDVAEGFFGHAPGRPTISRRVGRGIDGVFGCGEEVGTHVFHALLFVGAVAVSAKVAKK